MKRLATALICAILIAVSVAPVAHAGFWDSITSGLSDAWDWVSDAATDAWDWTSGAASDAWDWVSTAATDAWEWTSGAATDVWDSVTGFFDPPDTTGSPNVPQEPELPDGVQKMYLGYVPVKTGLDNGYSETREIDEDDPHYGITLGKFYVSGFSRAMSFDNETFVFLKNVGDNVELHFQLTQDIDMLGGDTFVTINSDEGGFDKYFEVSPTYFGRGTLIVRHTDYQNHRGEPQVYTDYLSGKMSGADTVIRLNEEGDYEVALDYEIKREKYVLGLGITSSDRANYRVFFRFSVRNGNCMIFPFDVITGEELRNSSVTPNGFYLDFAYSRYLETNVRYSVLVDNGSGIMEDVRYNRPAYDGATYVQEGIYTISVENVYTGETTVKRLYVGSDEKLMQYVSQGYSVAQIVDALNNR